MLDNICICKICNKEYKNVQALSKHITEKHKIDKKEYYDTYLKKENEGICKYCGKATIFTGLGGYNSNCPECSKAFHNSEEWKNNVQKTMLKRFGLICNLNSKENKEKANKAAHTKEAIEKHHKTMNERYGGNTTLQSEKLKKEVSKTMVELYGTDKILSLKEIQDKCKQTKKEKYGDENYTNREQGRETFLNRSDKEKEETYKKFSNTMETRYNGIGNASKTIQEKQYKTMKELYGFEYALQNKQIRDKAKKKYTYNNINFDSSWEIAYYIWLTDNKIPFEYHPKELDYYYPGDNKIHKYEPDFKINEEYIEIKNSKLLETMKDNTESKEYFKYICMIEHKVKIITDCSKYITYIEQKYGKHFLEGCKND